MEQLVSRIIGGMTMMYAYMILEDETEVTHSHLVDNNGESLVEVHFERPTANGFDVARCVLPEYKWVMINGYSQNEIMNFENYLKRNAHLIFKYASSGGIKLA